MRIYSLDSKFYTNTKKKKFSNTTDIYVWHLAPKGADINTDKKFVQKKKKTETNLRRLLEEQRGLTVMMLVLWFAPSFSHEAVCQTINDKVMKV